MRAEDLSQNPGAVSASGVRQQVGGRPSGGTPTCTTLTIPAPPSVNAMFANRPGGRFKTREYKNWLTEAGWMIREQLAREGCDPVPGRTLIVLSAEREYLTADIDNRVKAIFDLLVKMHVIDDDKWITGFATAWAPLGTGRHAKARVAIMPVQPLTLTFHPSADGATGGWFINAPEDDGEV